MKKREFNTESGNVLFLILIAVALFAALSYAVTSSTNSGGGNANDESTLVNSASITQYPAGIKTAMIRMQVSRGVATPSADADLEDGDDGFLFNKPADFDDIADGDEYRAVFHPSGGGASYVKATSGVLVEGAAGDWLFNMDFEVEDVGTSDDDAAGNEIIAFLPEVTSSICDRINEEVGVASTPVLSSQISITDNLEVDSEIASANPGTNSIGSTLGAADLDGSPYGCFRNGAGNEYVYYHVLIER